MTLNKVEYASTFCGLDNDRDSDSVKDLVDNCPDVYNPKQEDTTETALGYAPDGIGNVCDNCVYPNPLQTDTDGDGRGDDVLINNVLKPCDNCKDVANYDQTDSDKDGVGDACDNCKTSINPLQEDANLNGIGDACEGLDQGSGLTSIFAVPETFTRFVGDKRYELSNHLGNVLSVVSDRKLFQNSLGFTTFAPDVLSYSDYYPFGMLVPNRHKVGDDYRYGFQGQEKDDELKGEGNSLNYTFRMHDSRVGRFFAVDPLTKQYPFYSPYVFSGNRVIDAVELEGLEPKSVVKESSRRIVTIKDEGNPAENVNFTITSKITIVNYKYTIAATHLLSLVSGIPKKDIENTTIRNTGNSLMPAYDPNEGGGGLTFPGSSPGQYRMNLTDNFFSKGYGKNSFNDDAMEWLDISSHEVGHIKDIKEISPSKLKYFGTFIKEYATAGSHDGNPREQRAEKGTKEFRSFNKFIDSDYGKDKLKSLFENKHNKDNDIIERIDQWWGQYKKAKENQRQSNPKS